MSAFNLQFFYAACMIALGYLLKRIQVFKETDGEAIARLILNVTLPALILVSFRDMVFDWSLLWLIGISFIYGLFICLLGIFIFRKEERKIIGMQSMLIAGLNIGLFAYPLIEGIFGKESIQYFGMFDVGNAFIVFGVIYLSGSYFSPHNQPGQVKAIFKKFIRSIPLITYIIATSLAIAEIQLPVFFINLLDIIAKANMPLSFILLGIYLSFTLNKDHLRNVINVLLIRYGIGLIVGFLLFYILPFDDLFKYTMLLGFILPIAISVIPYSVEFDYDRTYVGTTSNLSILISFILLWILTNVMI